MQSEIIRLTSQLVAIDSVNPSLVAGGAGEVAISRFLRDWALSAGLEVDVLEATMGRPSVVIRARGTGGGRTLMLCAHTDTVNVAGMAGAHEPRVDGDRLYGRGAYDMKAGLAAALVACQRAAALGLAGDVVVAAVADEEHSSLGIQEVLRTVRADAAVVTEPTELELIVSHKGFVWLEVEVAGRAAHGSRPHLGVDAIVKTGPILTALGELDERLGNATHPLLGRGSIHASLIEGGVELSSYPGRCVLSLERRTLPGETEEDIVRELEELLERCRLADAALEASQQTLLVRPSFEVDADAEVVVTVQEAAADVLSSPPNIGGAGFWADTAFIAASGIPTVIFGPSGAGAHELEEWVSIADTVAVAETLVRVASRICA
jgi:acetylornithine deacetylase